MRYFYSKDFFGLGEYEDKREQLALINKNFVQDYKETLHNQNFKIKSSDLISIVRLCEKNDINLVMKLLWR